MILLLIWEKNQLSNQKVCSSWFNVALAKSTGTDCPDVQKLTPFPRKPSLLKSSTVFKMRCFSSSSGNGTGCSNHCKELFCDISTARFLRFLCFQKVWRNYCFFLAINDCHINSIERNFYDNLIFVEFINIFIISTSDF